MRLNEVKKYIIALFFRFVVAVYERIFREKMSGDVAHFLKNLYYVGIGTIVATIFSFSFNIFGARILGPTGYGTFTLIQSISMFLHIPMVFGLSTALVKYNSEKEDFNKQRCIISTTYIMVFISIVISLFFYYLFSTQISNVFSIPKEIFYASVIMAFLFVFYTLTINAIRSLHKMKMLSVLQPIFSIVLLVSFLIFISMNFISFNSMIFSMYLAYGITGGFISLLIRKYLRFTFNPPIAKILTKYGIFALFSSISFTLVTNIDKIFINKYMYVEDVAIYNSYYYASINIIGLFFGIFITVFFPTISKYKDKTVILKRVNKFIPYLIILGLPFILICEFIILNLYGEGYPIYFPMMLIFAITSILVTWYGIYAWIFNSQGDKGVKFTLFGTGTIAITNILLNIYLIPHHGLYGAIVATASAYCTGIFLLYIRRGNVLTKNHLENNIN